LDVQRKQGQTACRNVRRLPPLQQLKAELGQGVSNEVVTDVVKVSHERHGIRRLERRPAA